MKASLHCLALASLWALVAGCDHDALGIRTSNGDAPAASLSATPPAGPVTLTTLVDYSTPPFRGSFQVTRGAELLGCHHGRFVDAPVPLGVRDLMVAEFTCSEGPDGGTLTARFRPTSLLGSGGFLGDWEIVESTGGFARLSHGGGFSLRFTGPMAGTGEIQFEP